MTAYPAIEAAVKGDLVDLIVGEWTQLAIAHSATGAYVRGLHAAGSVLLNYEGNPLAIVVQNVDPKAIFVDEGHVGFHLPDHIAPSKWRISKKGKRYIIVPFRHFTGMDADDGPTGRASRAAMPAEIYARARSGGAVRGLGDLYKQSKSYTYFRAAGFGDLPHRADGTQIDHYTWKASKYEGLKKVGTTTPAGGSHNRYMTFRVITPESEGWYIPPVAGQHFPEQVAHNIAPRAEEILGQAAGADLVHHWSATLAAAGITTEIHG